MQAELDKTRQDKTRQLNFQVDVGLESCEQGNFCLCIDNGFAFVLGTRGTRTPHFFPDFA